MEKLKENWLDKMFLLHASLYSIKTAPLIYMWPFCILVRQAVI